MKQLALLCPEHIDKAEEIGTELQWNRCDDISKSFLSFSDDAVFVLQPERKRGVQCATPSGNCRVCYTVRAVGSTIMMPV